MSKFKNKSLIELSKMSIEELSEYYRKKRKYLYDENVPISGVKFRKAIHPLLLGAVKLDRKLSKETLTVISDRRKKTDSPVIYAATHIGGNDIQRTFEAIGEQAYLFLGDPKDLYKDPAGLLLYGNGTISFETNDKTDRKIAVERAKELLTNKGKLLIYPEGAWNLIDNLAVMKLYKGTMTMAKEVGATVVPIALEQYGSDFFANIGENIPFSDYSSMSCEDATLLLRDKLSTLKWEIWEQQEPLVRSSMTDDDKKTFYQFMVDKCSYGVTVEDIDRTRFHDFSQMPNRDELEEVKKLEKKF